MNNVEQLPFRQKVLIALTILAGIIIWASYKFQLIDSERLKFYIVLYSFSVSISLLTFETLIDLNNKKTFLIWLFIGLIHFAIYLLTKDDVHFKILRPPGFDDKKGVNAYFFDASTSSLKTLLIFLISYKLFNFLIKKHSGNYLLNTWRQHSWNHPTIKRRISVLDVIFNFLLYIIICISVFTK